MDKHKRLQKIPKFPIDEIGKSSHLASRGLKDLNIIPDDEKCRYCGALVDVFDSDKVCSFCLDVDFTEPRALDDVKDIIKEINSADYESEDLVNYDLRQNDYKSAHESLNWRITQDSSGIKIGGILSVALDDSPQRAVRIDDQFYTQSRRSSGFEGMGGEYEGRWYRYKPFKKAEIEEGQLNAMLWKAKLFEDQEMPDKAADQYRAILSAYPTHEYSKGKLNKVESN